MTGFAAVPKALFSSETRVSLLAHFFLHPGESYYPRQLERIIGKQVGQINRELQNLERIHLLRSSREGNQKRYSLNRDFPLYRELKTIFLKTAGAGSIIRECLEKLKAIELVFIYGSFAGGDEHAGSDLDLMIVGDISDREISRAVSRAEERIGRPVHHSLYSRQEVRKRIKKQDNFILTAFRGPHILICGFEDDELFGASQE